MPDFLLPDLGEGLTEAEIVNWLVNVGDEVAVDQPVVEVETAKAVVEVPVPYAGIVTAVHGRPGESMAVGSPLITVGGATHTAGAMGDSTTSAGAGFQRGRHHCRPDNGRRRGGQRECPDRLRHLGGGTAQAGPQQDPRRAEDDRRRRREAGRARRADCPGRRCRRHFPRRPNARPTRRA